MGELRVASGLFVLFEPRTGHFVVAGQRIAHRLATLGQTRPDGCSDDFEFLSANRK